MNYTGVVIRGGAGASHGGILGAFPRKLPRSEMSYVVYTDDK
jgi:hypothetical protein